MKHTVCTNVAYFSTHKNVFHQNNVKAAYLCSGFRCYYSTQHNDVKYPFIFTQCWCTACVNASAWRCWACLLLLCTEVKVRLTDCSREGGCSVPDVVQTAVPPEALQSIHTLSRLLQTAHGVLASSKNTARFHPAARLIRCDGFSMIHPAGTAWGLERVPSDFVFHVPVADHVVRRPETLADKHAVPSPQTMACLNCLQLWVSSCWWLLSNSQRCCQSQSELSTAAPKRAEPGGKHSVWLTLAQEARDTCCTGLCAYFTVWKLETTSQSKT